MSDIKFNFKEKISGRDDVIDPGPTRWPKTRKYYKTAYNSPPSLKGKIAKYRLWLTKVAQVAQATFNIYNSAKSKDAVSVILASTSAIGTVSALFDSINHFGLYNFGSEIMGPDSNYLMSETSSAILDLLKKSNIPMEENVVEAVQPYIVYTFHTEQGELYFAQDKNNKYDLIGPMAYENKTEKIMKNIFSEMFPYGVSVAQIKGKVSFLDLKQFNDVDMNYFVPSVDETKLIEQTKRFLNQNFNRSLLLYGPAGVGKSTFALRLAQNLGGFVFKISDNFLANYDFADDVYRLINLFNPKIILFDDIDRMSSNHDLLTMMEDFSKIKTSEPRVVMATINDLESLDTALRRPGRFDQTIKFNLPKDELRKNILLSYLAKFNAMIPDDLISEIVHLSEGMTGAYIEDIAKFISIDNEENSVIEYINNCKKLMPSFDMYEDEDSADLF